VDWERSTVVVWWLVHTRSHGSDIPADLQNTLVILVLASYTWKGDKTDQEVSTSHDCSEEGSPNG
jgi:hypothetical protein